MSVVKKCVYECMCVSVAGEKASQREFAYTVHASFIAVSQRVKQPGVTKSISLSNILFFIVIFTVINDKVDLLGFPKRPLVKLSRGVLHQD